MALIKGPDYLLSFENNTLILLAAGFVLNFYASLITRKT